MFKKQLPIIFIGLCVVVAILVLSWTVFVKTEVIAPVLAPVVDDENDEIIPPDDIENDDVSEIDTSDWKTYRNEEYGFEFKYPEDFELYISKSDKLYQTYNDKLIVEVNKLLCCDFSFEDGMSMEVSYSTDKSKYPDMDDLFRAERRSMGKETFTVEKYSYKNFEGVKTVGIYPKTSRGDYIDLFLKTDDGFYFFSWYAEDPENRGFTYTNYFIPMLSTLKFTEPVDISDWKTYRNEELGLEFKYPKEWGDLLKSEEDFSGINVLHPSRIRVSISNLKDNPVILEVDNGEDRMGRGKFTGDIVIDVNSQDYIENFCQNQKDKNISKCEHKVNSNNISFVKYEDELCSEGGCFGKGLFYLIYNSNSEYRGILLYTYNIQEDKIIVDHKEEMILDSLIDNLKFNK